MNNFVQDHEYTFYSRNLEKKLCEGIYKNKIAHAIASSRSKNEMIWNKVFSLQRTDIPFGGSSASGRECRFKELFVCTRVFVCMYKTEA